MNVHPSIFNDVLSPVTRGPSSSNTCGVYRIAHVARQLFGEEPASLRVEMSTEGAFMTTFYGMGSDLAFIAGILDKDMSTYDLEQAYADAQAAGIQIDYCFSSDLPGDRFELAILTLTSVSGRKMRIEAASTGGGGFVISAVDGCPIHITGKDHELVVYTDNLSDAALEAVRRRVVSKCLVSNSSSRTRGETLSLINVKAMQPFDSALLDSVRRIPGVLSLVTVLPEYIVIHDRQRTPPFGTYQELLDYVQQREVSLWQAAVDYEMALSGWSEHEILAFADKLLAISMASVESGQADDLRFSGIVAPKAAALMGCFRETRLLPLGMLQIAGPAALAVMEHSNAHGLVVCMPTGGSSGIVPGAIYGAARSMDICRQKQVRSLLIAGLVGLMMYKTNYSGEIGCQAEIGCGAAMAAAALTYFLTDDVGTILNAASLAVQSFIGLLCDPVAGLVQVPCLIRNMTAVSVAAMVANASACGFPATIPFDEMVDSMLRIGARIRMCGDCGAAGTPTGYRLAEAYRQDNRQ